MAIEGSEKPREVVVGIGRHLTIAEAQALSARAQEHLPDSRVLFIEGATFAATVGEGSDADLIIAATRLHDALYRKGGEMDERLGDDVATAFGQLQRALRARGWTP